MKKPWVPNNWIFKIATSLIVSIYIVFHGRTVNLSEAVTMPIFYAALIVSSAVAFLMVSIIDVSNRWLDRKYDWVEEKVKRSAGQLALCIVLPLMFDFILLSVYFHFLGTSIFVNGFLNYDFPLVVCFTFIINFYYITVSLFAKKHEMGTIIIAYKQKENLSKQDELSFDRNIPEVRSNSSVLVLDLLCPALHGKNISLPDDVLYFFKDNKQVVLVTTDGEEYKIKCNLTFLVNHFSKNEFIRINRSIIINSNIITGYSNGSKRDTLNLHFPDKHKDHFGSQIDDRFAVTKNYISAITRLF